MARGDDVDAALDALKAQGDAAIKTLLAAAGKAALVAGGYTVPPGQKPAAPTSGSGVLPRGSAEKPGFELLPGEALGLVNEAMRSGVGKYGAWDWASGVSVAEYGSKAIGHILDGLRGLPVDAQSGVTPFAHAAADLLILMSCLQRGVARDVPAPCADVRPCREFSYQKEG